jgi:hypothetical protein
MKRELTNVAYDIYHSRLKNRPPGPFPPIAGEPRLSRFLLSSWPVSSHCKGTPAFPLSPFLPGPFPPIAREPRLSRFLPFFLARSLPLRGNPGLPAFSFLPGPFLPAVKEPRPSRFPFTLLSLAPKQVEPAASRSDRKDSKYEPRSPPTPARNTLPGH